MQEAGLAQCLPLSMRQGLPAGFVYDHGLHAMCAADVAKSDAPDGKPAAAADEPEQPAATQGVAKSLAQRLRDTADMIDGAAPVVTAVAAQMAEEFMLVRLPPPPGMLPEQGPEPTLNSRICCRGKVCK